MDINHPFLFIIRNKKLPKEHDILFIAKIEELKDKGKNENEKKVEVRVKVEVEVEVEAEAEVIIKKNRNMSYH